MNTDSIEKAVYQTGEINDVFKLKRYKKTKCSDSLAKAVRNIPLIQPPKTAK